MTDYSLTATWKTLVASRMLILTHERYVQYLKSLALVCTYYVHILSQSHRPLILCHSQCNARNGPEIGTSTDLVRILAELTTLALATVPPDIQHQKHHHNTKHKVHGKNQLYIKR